MENKLTLSERFSSNVQIQYCAEVGKSNLSEYEQMLLQHLFIKINYTLIELEKKRDHNKNKLEYKWSNLNMEKLAIDSVNRIQLGLDALIPNHISPIAYKNKSGKYDLDLRIGYAGKLFYKKNISKEEILDIRIELVHETDQFIIHKKSKDNPIENYTFNINSPFDRGPVKAGFGYVVYKNEILNKLTIVTMEHFKKAKENSLSNKFWEPYSEEMMIKTIIHRTMDRVEIDPRKIKFEHFKAESEQYEIEEKKEIISFESEHKSLEQKEENEIKCKGAINMPLKESQFIALEGNTRESWDGYAKQKRDIDPGF